MLYSDKPQGKLYKIIITIIISQIYSNPTHKLPLYSSCGEKEMMMMITITHKLTVSQKHYLVSVN